MIRKNWIYDVAVESAGHAAPMGVKFTGRNKVVLEVYKSAKTCRNIEDEGEYTIYLLDDALALETVLKSKHVKRGRPQVKVKVTGTADLGDRKRFTGEVTSKIPSNIYPMNRAQYLFLEALIESTKPKPRKKRIGECLRVIKKVAPNSAYEKETKKILETWGV